MNTPDKPTQKQTQKQSQIQSLVDPDSGVYRGPPGEAAKNADGSRADSCDGTRSDGDLPALQDASETAERRQTATHREDSPAKGERL